MTGAAGGNRATGAAVQLRIAPHATFRRLKGKSGGVVLHLRTTAYFRLNELGAMIWQHLEQPGTLDELVSRIREQVEDPPGCLGQDIARFIEELASRDLLIREPLDRSG